MHADHASESWWIFALHGLLATVFGVLSLLWPGVTMLWLILLFALFALLAGATWLAGAFQARGGDRRWWLMLLIGLVSAGAGFLAVFKPGLTALALVILMGANALATGLMQIALGIRLRKVVRYEWLIIGSGAVSAIFGAVVLAAPGAGALALVWMIACYAIASGVLMLAASLRVRSEERHPFTPAMTL